MPRLLTSIPLLAGLIATACTQSSGLLNSEEAPGWITGQPQDYPDSRYLHATGSASTAERAQDRALANLAKIFEMQVRESSTTTQDVQSFRAGGVESVEASARIASRVNIHTSEMIAGARVAARWQSPADLTHHALAVLDRSQASNNVRGEIDRLDREIAYIMATAETRPPDLRKVADLQAAIVMLTERNALQKTLKVLDLRGLGKPTSWKLSELKAEQMQVIRSMNMRAVVSADAVGDLAKMLQGAMANAGFDAAVDYSGYVLSATVATQDMIEQQGWYWLRGTLELGLLSPDGTSLGNKSWALKVSAQQPDQLNQRMLAEIDRTLKSELKQTVLDFAVAEQ